MDDREVLARRAVYDLGIKVDCKGGKPPSLQELAKACDRRGAPRPRELKEALKRAG
ncbi:MAG: hypothetical protein AB7W59_24515 [Acidimicrobiia bacterium]